MDYGNASTSAPVPGLRKRPRSPDFGNGYSGFGPAPLALDHTVTGAQHRVDITSKRPRLSSSTDTVLSAPPPPGVTLCRHLTLADLPPEILQYVFTFADPLTLGQLISVNHRFRSLLDPACPLPHKSAAILNGDLAVRPPDSVWTLSRRTFLPGFPKPMHTMTELEMWRLVRGRSCQFCGRKSSQRLSFSITDPWSAGPGLDNVRPIWPFRILSCGRCLQPRLVKDTELAFSSNSALRSGLPFAFLTQGLNYIPSWAIHHRTPPPHLELIKYYFKPQLEELEIRFRNVEALGAATLGEWRKGLETSGQERNADASRFEQCELHDGFSRISSLADHTDTMMLASAEAIANQHLHMSKVDCLQHASMRSAAGTPSSGYIPLALSTAGSIADDSVSTAGKSSNGILPASTGVPLHQEGLRRTAPRPSRQRTERSHREAIEAKAERRKEIERRCLTLDPPIMPSTLTYMDAFQAAILISSPFDDRAWEYLKPRLLSQHANAEQQEMRAALSDPSVQQAKRQQLVEEQLVARQNASHMWHGLKIPSREKLRKIAEEFIHLTWSNGRAVTSATASKFAAEVLSHVRQRFDETIAQEDHMLALKGTAFPQDPESLACRKLNLQDMKWAFQEFVLPHTQPFGKELFLCHVCDNNQKLFAFEPVIQHFASKHTHTLSHGNSIVSWDADWPTDPPFDPHPNIPWALGGTNPAPQSHLYEKPRSLPSHDLPSSSGKEPRPLNAVPRRDPRFAEQPSHHLPTEYVPGYIDQVPAGFGARPSPMAHTSVPRSVASVVTLEDDYHFQDPPVLPPPGTEQASLYPFTSAGLTHTPFQHHLGRGAVHSSGRSENSDRGRWWGPWREQPPLSHSSVVYSCEDGSSRLSYVGSPAKLQGAGSEAGRESQAPSRVSSHREKGLQPGSSLNELDSSSISVDQTAARRAVENFLDSFDPVTGGGASRHARTPAVSAHSSSSELPLNLSAARQAGGRTPQHSSWTIISSPTVNHLPPFSPSPHRTTLPIRDSEHRPTLTSDSPVHPRYSPSLWPAQDHEFHQRPASGRLYPEESPGRLDRTHYGNEREIVHGPSSAFTGSSYEHRFFYDRDGRRYEEIRESGGRRYSAQPDESSGRPRDHYLPAGLRYVDEEDHCLDQNIERGHYGRAVLRDYRMEGTQHRAQQALSPSLNGHYHEANPFVTDRRTRTIRFDDRDVVYQPVERAMQPAAARPLAMSRPED